MNYKTIFIVDPIRGERIQLAKFLSEEVFTVMTFISPNDCFKKPELINCDLMVFVPRKEKNEVKHLMNIKKKFRRIPIIFILNEDFPDINLAEITATDSLMFTRPQIMKKCAKYCWAFLLRRASPRALKYLTLYLFQRKCKRLF